MKMMEKIVIRIRNSIHTADGFLFERKNHPGTQDQLNGIIKKVTDKTFPWHENDNVC